MARPFKILLPGILPKNIAASRPKNAPNIALNPREGIALSIANSYGLFAPEGYIFIGIVLEGIYKRRYRAFIIAGIVYAISWIRFVISLLLG